MQAPIILPLREVMNDVSDEGIGEADVLKNPGKGPHCDSIEDIIWDCYYPH